MTEDEAKTKWCPFAREAQCGQNEAPASYNRVDDKPVTLCIGSECMAFRWLLSTDEHESTIDKETHHGYCGLAR